MYGSKSTQSRSWRREQKNSSKSPTVFYELRDFSSTIRTMNYKHLVDDCDDKKAKIKFEKTGQKLTDFFSEDSLHCKSEAKKRRKSHPTHHVPTITDIIQTMLWNMPHSRNSDNLPGKLSLCIGMPVMIRNNGATELCITKGQEATVYGWQTERGSRNQIMLETLFVKLIDLLRPVNIENLPENVVPLMRNTNQIVCSLPDDTNITITRVLKWVLM
jgi:hypothetical protein